MFLNNRYHDPVLGRFISVDPMAGVDPHKLVSVLNYDGTPIPDQRCGFAGRGVIMPAASDTASPWAINHV